MMAGYMVEGRRKASRLEQRFIKRMERVDFSVLTRRARLFVLAAVPMFGYVYWSYGEIPLLSGNAAANRYINHFRPEYLGLAFLLNRSRELFQTMTPVLVISISQFARRFVDAVFIVVAVSCLIMLVQRGPLLSMIFVIGVIFLQHKHWKVIIAIMPLLLVGYL